ncbi:MAG: hypothetical protein IRZ16_03425 [Myxococcaceae bacterium]|nr:hypothetical protein [Myxococcaceae bacterium]
MSALPFEDALEGFRRLWVRSDALEVAVLPELGGKLQTLRLLGDDHNVLLEPPELPYLRPFAGAPFDAFDTSGWDECFPTITACEHQGSRHSDHGELWSAPWMLGPHSPDRLTLHAVVKDRPWSFTRTLEVRGPTLTVSYELTSRADVPQDVLWSAHPLLTVSEGSRIELPEEVRTARVESAHPDRFGGHGATIAWPVHEGEALDRLQGIGRRTADKLFVGPLDEGRCAFHDEASGVTITFRFDPAVLPYVGLWICEGGWPSHPGRRRHHTVALEPCTAPMDSLAEAAAQGHAWRLQPHETRRWTLEVTLTRR